MSDNYIGGVGVVQPPSGGCVLKLLLLPNSKQIDQVPAAFGRLCVETILFENYIYHLNTSRLRAAVC